MKCKNESLSNLNTELASNCIKMCYFSTKIQMKISKKVTHCYAGNKIICF